MGRSSLCLVSALQCMPGLCYFLLAALRLFFTLCDFICTCDYTDRYITLTLMHMILPSSSPPAGRFEGGDKPRNCTYIFTRSNLTK